MKTIISLVVLSFSLIALTGCYTRVVTSDSYDGVYEKPETTIVVIQPLPPPDPCPCPPPHHGPRPPVIIHPSPPVHNPDPPQKIRQPITTRPSDNGNVRDDLRRSGSRDNTDKRKR